MALIEFYALGWPAHRVTLTPGKRKLEPAGSIKASRAVRFMTRTLLEQAPQAVIDKISASIDSGNEAPTIEILVECNAGKTRFHLERMITDHHIHSPLGEITPEPNGLGRCRLRFRLPRHQRLEFLDELASLAYGRQINDLPNEPCPHKETAPKSIRVIDEKPVS
jgi:hypothetical protein